MSSYLGRFFSLLVQFTLNTGSIRWLFHFFVESDLDMFGGPDKHYLLPRRLDIFYLLDDSFHEWIFNIDVLQHFAGVLRIGADAPVPVLVLCCVVDVVADGPQLCREDALFIRKPLLANDTVTRPCAANPFCRFWAICILICQRFFYDAILFLFGFVMSKEV